MVASNELQGPNPTQKAESQARLQAARDYNAQVTQQRENAPSAIKSGSTEDSQVRTEEKQDAQQSYFNGGFAKSAGSNDSFSAQREAALKSGSFDYSAVRSASYSPPPNFVNNQGQRVQRNAPSEVANVLVASNTFGSNVPGQYGNVTSMLTQKSSTAAKVPSSVSGGKVIDLGGTTLTDPSVISDMVNARGSLAQGVSQYKNQGFTFVDVLNDKGTVLASVPIDKAQQTIQDLANKYSGQTLSYQGTKQQSTNPVLRQQVLSEFTSNPSFFKPGGSAVDKTSFAYLQDLSRQGVLLPEDFTQFQGLTTQYNKGVQANNTQVRQQNIQSSVKELGDINTTLTQAQKAGVTSVNIMDAKGNVLGTVNPQNLGQARLQSLKLFTRSGGSQFSYSVAKPETTPGVESRITTYSPSNVLTAFTGGALGTFAEAGLVGLGLVSKLTGKEFTVPGTNTVIKPTGIIAQAESKVQKTFGKETIDKIISGEKVDYSSPIELASLTGLGASILATGGTGALKTVAKAPSVIAELLRSPGIAKTIATKEIQEGPALSQLSKVKGSNTLFEFEQGTEGKSGVLNAKLEQGAIQWVKQENGQYIPVRPQMPKEVKITSGEKEVTTTIPYAVIQASNKGVTSIVTKGVTNLTPQEIAIKGLPPEVAEQMGLKQVAGKGISQVYKGKLTSKNIPILLEEIRVGNIKPGFDVLQYPTKDIAKGRGRYGMMSRSPEMLSSNAFERVTRPNVVRYFESKVELEKEVIPKSTAKSGMSPIGKILQGKGGAGASGKAKTMLSQEEKSLVQSLTKENISSKVANQKASLYQKAITTGTAQVRLTRGRTREEFETIYTTKPGQLGSTRELTRLETKKESVPIIPILENVRSPLLKKEKTSTVLIPKSYETVISKSTGKTSQKQTQVTDQITKQTETYGNKLPSPSPEEPDNKKRFGALVPGLNPLSGGLGKVTKYGSAKSYVGNVPLSSLVGIYKRSEVTYGNASEKLTRSSSGSSNKFGSLSRKNKSPKLI